MGPSSGPDSFVRHQVFPRGQKSPETLAHFLGMRDLCLGTALVPDLIPVVDAFLSELQSSTSRSLVQVDGGNVLFFLSFGVGMGSC